MQYLNQRAQLVPQGGWEAGSQAERQAGRQAGERVINLLQPDRKYITKDRKII